MSLLQLKKQNLDFNKAYQQLKRDIKLKFNKPSISKQLRFNLHNSDKENQSANFDPRALKLLNALQKPLIRVIKDLRAIRVSVVCEKSIFDDVNSVVVSEENSESHLEQFQNQLSQIESMIKLNQCDAYKISFANLRCDRQSKSKTNFSSSFKVSTLNDSEVYELPIRCHYTSQHFNQLNIILGNIRKHKIQNAFQEIRIFVMIQDLNSISNKLENAKMDTLRRVINNKIKADKLMLTVCLRYWLTQTYNIKLFDYFVDRVQYVFTRSQKHYLQILNKRSKNIKLIDTINKLLVNRSYQVFKQMQLRVIQQKFVNIFEQINYTKLRIAFNQIRNKRKTSTKLFTLLQEYENNQQRRGIKIIFLNMLQERRKQNSILFGIECLQRNMNCIEFKYVFDKLQNKKQKRKFILPSKYLVVILNNLKQKQLCQVLLKLKSI